MKEGGCRQAFEIGGRCARRIEASNCFKVEDFQGVKQRSFILADYFEPDRYTRFQIADRTLDTAIVQAEITRVFEEYLEIFDEILRR